MYIYTCTLDLGRGLVSEGILCFTTLDSWGGGGEKERYGVPSRFLLSSGLVAVSWQGTSCVTARNTDYVSCIINLEGLKMLYAYTILLTHYALEDDKSLLFLLSLLITCK